MLFVQPGHFPFEMADAVGEVVLGRAVHRLGHGVELPEGRPDGTYKSNTRTAGHRYLPPNRLVAPALLRIHARIYVHISAYTLITHAAVAA
jgi:hypothetical protein